MEVLIVSPRFPIYEVKKKAGGRARPWTKLHLEKYEDMASLSRLENYDSREHPHILFLDADGRRVDLSINWLFKDEWVERLEASQGIEPEDAALVAFANIAFQNMRGQGERTGSRREK